jgi:SagB-type dehydrogenase family enzyme
MKLCETLVNRPIKREPKPRLRVETASAVLLPVRRTLRCPPISSPPLRSFEEVLNSRRSRREIVRAPLRKIINTIAFAVGPQFILSNDPLKRTRRPAPSAGALHPIDILIADWSLTPRLMRYDALFHRLDILAPRAESACLQEFRTMTLEILPRASGTAIILVGDIGRITASYENAESLLWRDAGFLLQTIFLSATAFGLAFCPLGMLGQQIVQYLGLESTLVAAGVAVIGESIVDH